MDNNIISIQAESGQVAIKFSGNLTLQNIAGIKTEIDKVLAKAKSLQLTASEVEDIDLSFVQLILSLKAYCKTKSISVETKFELPNESERLLAKAGLKLN